MFVRSETLTSTDAREAKDVAWLSLSVSIPCLWNDFWTERCGGKLCRVIGREIGGNIVILFFLTQKQSTGTSTEHASLSRDLAKYHFLASGVNDACSFRKTGSMHTLLKDVGLYVRQNHTNSIVIQSQTLLQRVHARVCVCVCVRASACFNTLLLSYCPSYDVGLYDS